MNIEKSIEILKAFRNYNKFYKEENKDLTITITLDAKESIDKAIERLLTAYEKEKEKNKELEKMIKKDKDALQFKVGDIVRLKYKSPCTFAIEEGAVCKITNIERQARYPIEIENKFNGIKGYVAENYIEKIEVEE